jgi:ribosomal protein S12 methylthiotransferase accessory factor
LPAQARWWLGAATAAGEPHLLPDPGRVRPPTRARRTTGGATGSFGRLAARLSEKGLEVLVSDQTRPGSRFPVVRVVVPGLRSWWPRFAPGRLYQAPVTAGWRARPRRESELNPLAFFL